MKKAVLVILSVVMVMQISVLAFATADLFILSPELLEGPEIIRQDPDDPECSAFVQILPYGRRKELTEENMKEFEEQYLELYKAKKITDIQDDLKERFIKIAKELGIDIDELKLSDYFYMELVDPVEHDQHPESTVSLVLRSKTFENFVGVLAFDGSKWVFIDNVELLDGNKISFQSNIFGPYAIIVNTHETSVDTGDSMNFVYLGLAVVALCGGIVLCVASRKSRKEA